MDTSIKSSSSSSSLNVKLNVNDTDENVNENGLQSKLSTDNSASECQLERSSTDIASRDTELVELGEFTQDSKTEDNAMLGMYDRCKDKLGEDKINEITTKFDKLINDNTKLKDFIKDGGLDIDTLNFEQKALIVSSLGMLDKIPEDEMSVKYPKTTVAFSVVTCLFAGANTYNLAPGTEIEFDRLRGSQYTTTLTILSFIFTSNKIGKAYDRILEDYNKANNIEPSNNKFENFCRVCKHINTTGKVEDVSWKSMAALSSLSMILGALYGSVDCQNAGLGVRHIGDKWGVDGVGLDIFQYLGLAGNLIPTCLLGGVFFYDLITDAISKGKTIKGVVCPNTNICANTNKNNTPRNIDNLGLNKIKDQMLEVIENTICENAKLNFEDMQSNIEDNLLKCLNKYEFKDKNAELNNFISTLVSTAENTNPKISDAVKAGSYLAFVVVMMSISAYSFGAVFGSSLTITNTLNHFKNANGSFTIPMEDGSFVNATSIADCISKIADFSDIDIDESIQSESNTSDSIVKMANILQGSGIAPALIATLTEQFGSFKEYIRNYKALAPSKVAIDGLALGLGCAFTYAVGMPYMETIMSTKDVARANFQIEGPEVFADHPVVPVTIAATSLGVFAVITPLVVGNILKQSCRYMIGKVKGWLFPKRLESRQAKIIE